MPERLFIIADDLTGACDSAAPFAAAGHCARVFLESSAAGAIGDGEAEVIAITTESRDMDPAEAASRIATVMNHLQVGPGDLLFKKIDSAGRGPFAAEVEAALNASAAALALVTPAFPAAGRTVKDGILTVCDASGQQAEIDLKDLFGGESAFRVLVLPVSDEPALHRTMVRAFEDKVDILLCDAIEQSDLDRIAAAGLRSPERILWTGSAGLARALASQIGAKGGPGVHCSLNSISRRVGPAVLFTGTQHPVTALQVEHLEQMPQNDRSFNRAIHRLSEANASPAAAVAAFTLQPHSGLILTGGDTAAFVLRTLGAHSIRLADEVAPGIPWGVVEGGLADGCAVVTKSGGFGERDALVRAFEFCESYV